MRRHTSTTEPVRPTPVVSRSPSIQPLHDRVNEWFRTNARDLPWRRADCSPWGVFVSEVMAQQTPLARVEPVWHRWMERWPTPTDLARDSPGEAVRAWQRLGYPRRALRLHAAAEMMVERYGGEVPDTVEGLLALPGVGGYTAAAVACFAFRRPEPVVDTNVRRVLARAVGGAEHPAPSPTRAESDRAARLMPTDTDEANTWNVAAMELGALVCTARSPRCSECPVLDLCAWQAAGRPAYDGPPRRGQAWHGTDRQVRGRVLALLRESSQSVSSADLSRTGDDPGQVDRCIHSLVVDGLIEPVDEDRFRLPR